MGLINTIDLLKHAEKHTYAVGAFNIINLEFLNAILSAAEAEKAPVICNIAEVHFPFIDIEQIAPVVQNMANKVCVPVVLNLDHGLTMKAVVQALRCGFSSIMFDGSTKPLEQNIADTRRVVEMAHPVGVSVEGELGCIPGAEGGSRDATAKSEFFTNPDDAERFVDETGVDALALSCGNVHGFYRGAPELDFALIENIRGRTGVPLVLHGGSGISDDDFRRAVSCGVRKINIYTDMSAAAIERLSAVLAENSGLMIPDIMAEMKDAVAQVVHERIRVFGGSGACSLAGNICPTGGAHGSCGGACTSQTRPDDRHTASSGGTTNESSFTGADIKRIVEQVTRRIMNDGR
jgi:fructose-bisphosphate aldolase, class II